MPAVLDDVAVGLEVPAPGTVGSSPDSYPGRVDDWRADLTVTAGAGRRSHDSSG